MIAEVASQTPFPRAVLLVKRVTGAFVGRRLPSLRRFFSLIYGFPMDAIVYLRATLKMARDRGAGYW